MDPREIKEDERIDEVANTGMTQFGSGQRYGSWFYPMGKLGRFFAKFFAEPAKPFIAANERGEAQPDVPDAPHPLAGDTIISPDVIKGDKRSPSWGKSGQTQPILPEQEVARRRRYREYEDMDEYPEISTAFDIYADDSTQRDLKGGKWIIETDDPLVKKEVENLFQMIRLDLFIWDIVRNCCKYGDCFIETVVDMNAPKVGIQKIKVLNPNFLLRVENEYGYLTDFLQEIPLKNDWDAFGSAGELMSNRKFIELNKHQVVHFRLQTSDPHFYPYGRSITAGSRSTFRSLKLMEDAMLIYRLQRAPERRVFYIDVGQMPTSKAEMFIERIKQKFKKEKFYDNTSNTISERYNPMSADEDFFVPVKGKSQGTKIETLPGAQNLGDVDDVKYFRDKLLAALKVPKDYIVEKDKSPERKANLSQLDVKFARTIVRVQKNIELGLRELVMRHLIIKEFPAQQIKELLIRLPEPSDMFLKRKLDVEDQRTAVVTAVLGLAGADMQPLFSRETIYKEYYNLNELERDEEEKRVKKEQDAAPEQPGMEGDMGMGAPMGAPGGGGMPGEEPNINGTLTGDPKGDQQNTGGIEPAENKMEARLDALVDLKKKYLLSENRQLIRIIDRNIKKVRRNNQKS